MTAEIETAVVREWHGEAHGARRTKEYRAWSHIRSRCHTPTDKDFYNYGGRGIAVCDEWRASFEAFLRDVGRAPTASHTLDRLDNDQDYKPGNVRWALRADQSRNTRRNVLIEGKVLKDYCLEKALSYDAVQARLRRGHPLHIATSSLIGAAYRRALAGETNHG